MHKILIDKATIRKNPEYMDYHVKHYVRGPVMVFVNGRSATNEEYKRYFNGDWRFFRDNNLALEIIREAIHINTQPPSEYLFDYIPTPIKCYFCKKEFYHNELTYDYNSNVENICPCCGMGYCCDVEFENLTDDLIENKKM